jgi:hypothetical protein
MHLNHFVYYNLYGLIVRTKQIGRWKTGKRERQKDFRFATTVLLVFVSLRSIVREYNKLHLTENKMLGETCGLKIN